MRITDQHLWNIAFTIFFLGVVVAAGIILERQETFAGMTNITFMEFVILGLASMRLTRLFVYDKITAFFREQFFDVDPMTGGLVKPLRGPRRTLAELLLCPWCVGMWAGAAVVFCYYLSSAFWYPILFLAIAGLGSVIQILANMIGWQAEKLKHEAGE
jgi:hypothetical protein